MSLQWERDEAEMIAIVADRIRRVQAECTYDYRKDIDPSILAEFPHINEDYHVVYGKNKYAVARVLRPTTIYEVGIGWGLSARAFLYGWPWTTYFGIDNGAIGVNVLKAISWSSGLYQITDSDALEKFVHPYGRIDLIHIDGCHERAHKKRDVVKALQSGAEWLLVDDMHNQQVAAGTFDAFYEAWDGSCIPMVCMENSHTGGMLFHIGNREGNVNR